jgi:hypothetical protein
MARRALGAVCAIGAALCLLAVAAFGYFSTPGVGSGNASTGSVSLALNAPATTTCSYSTLVPGDLTGAQHCALSVTYTGASPAWVSLTVAIQAKAGAGGTSLYDGTNSHGLTFSVSDGVKSFTVPITTTSPTGCPATYTCWTAANDLAAWYTGSTPTLAFTNTKVATWTVTPLLPKTVLNPYQGGTANLILTARAVQAEGNALPSSCTTTTVGVPCPATGTFSWG